MPASKASLDAFLAAQSELDTYDAGRAPILAKRDAAANVLAAEMAVGETISTVPTPPPVIRKAADGSIELVTHDYPGA